MKKILYVSSSRADYGIVKTLLKKLSSKIEVDILITGSHLEKQLGYTLQAIDKSIYKNVYQVPMGINNTDNKSLIKGTNILQEKLVDILDHSNYDMIMILGDRFEMLPVAYVASLYNIHICHLHGGELTLGNYDEQIRHAITKLSTLHLCSTQEYAKRVRQMGERYVYNVGSLSIESIQIDSNANKGNELVVMYHPETLSTFEKNMENVCQLVAALEELKKVYELIYIKGNIDTDAYKLEQPIINFFNNNNLPIYSSLSQEDYFTLLARAKAIVGNSSSGIIEAPSLKCPTINLGNRQEGRVRAKSVIDLPFSKKLIVETINEIKFDDGHFSNPYYQANASENAMHLICDFLKLTNIEKRFVDYE